jgi:hypothetical protein
MVDTYIQINFGCAGVLQHIIQGLFHTQKNISAFIAGKFLFRNFRRSADFS